MHRGADPERGQPAGLDDQAAPGAGHTGATYAIELIPATGQIDLRPDQHDTATASMIEQTGLNAGSFRIRSTGFSGTSRSRSSPPSNASFLDYVYFTQLETSDPVTYGYAEPVDSSNGAYDQCELT